MKLSKTEEELMNHLWKLNKAFMKDLLEVYPEPKPATTTISPNTWTDSLKPFSMIAPHSLLPSLPKKPI